MDANHVNAITRAAKSIMVSHLGMSVEVNAPYVTASDIASEQISVILGVNGELEGQIICSMKEDTAKSIVGTMMGGMDIQHLDDMSWSAIQEFGNWIAGTTATELSKEATTIDVTPPVINEGASSFHASSSFITLPLTSQIGDLNVHVSVKKSKALK
ncbi:chemotaxis protein CheX [Salsuginibacillus kocurii]|uniref:chemotaxis protein CheX n=1 Tax=Salsuginibacillus kocurii TaxID=427078 RepID=UPI00037384E0|nr:chemotaxis protein CheX [Salsuginibacillus kocurii]